MQDQIDKYLEWKGLHRDWAANRYEVWLKRFKQYIAKPSLEDVDEDDLISFSKHMKDLVKSGKYKHKSYEYCMTIIKNFLNFWHMRDHTIVSPKIIVVPSTRADSHNPLKKEDYKRIIEYIPLNNFRDVQKSLVVRMLWDTACRVSEVLSIDLHEMDLETRSAVIENRKRKDKRRIFWSEETHMILITKYLPMRRELARSQALFIGLLTNGTVTERLTTRSAQRYIKGLQSKLKIPYDISPHSFRHGKAHYMMDSGATVATISNILGHKSPGSSFTYLQYAGKDLYDKAQQFMD